MASMKIGVSKSTRTNVSSMSKVALEEKLTNPNVRGRDAHKIRMEMLKRG